MLGIMDEGIPVAQCKLGNHPTPIRRRGKGESTVLPCSHELWVKRLGQCPAAKIKDQESSLVSTGLRPPKTLSPDRTYTELPWQAKEKESMHWLEGASQGRAKSHAASQVSESCPTHGYAATLRLPRRICPAG